MYVPALIFSILNLPFASDADPKVVPSSITLAKGSADLFEASKISPSILKDWAKSKFIKNRFNKAVRIIFNSFTILKKTASR